MCLIVVGRSSSHESESQGPSRDFAIGQTRRIFQRGSRNVRVKLTLVNSSPVAPIQDGRRQSGPLAIPSALLVIDPAYPIADLPKESKISIIICGAVALR